MSELVSTYHEPERRVPEKQPLSFDLAFEKRRIREAKSPAELEQYFYGFEENMAFWSREYIARIPTVHYVWNIEQQADGSTRLHHPSFGYADEVSWNGAYGLEIEDLPQFERDRRAIEHTVTLEMNKQLETADAGSKYVWTSPPPEGIQNESYGGYTMTHVYEVVQLENGRKILKGRDILHTASNQKQKKVLEQLGLNNPNFSDNPSANELLGTLVEVGKSTTISEIERLLKQGRGLDLSKQEQDLEEFNRLIATYREKVIKIFGHLCAGNDFEAVTLFQDWVTQVDTDWQNLQIKQAQKAQFTPVETRDDWELLREPSAEHMDLPPGLRMQQTSTSTEVVKARGGSCGKGFGMSGVESQSKAMDTGKLELEAFGYESQLTSASLAGNRVVDKKSVNLVDDEEADETFLKSVYGVDDLDCRAFRCPQESCRKINIRPYNGKLERCLHCFTNKVSC